jgi:hypothetical protein
MTGGIDRHGTWPVRERRVATSVIYDTVDR